MNNKHDCMRFLLKKSFLTGSRKFKVANETSDWDRCISNRNWSKADPFGWGLDLDYTSHDYNEEEFQCFFITYKKKTYNFLVFWSKEELRSYFYATKMMCKYIDTKLIERKYFRVTIFEALKHIYKSINKPTTLDKIEERAFDKDGDLIF